MAEWPKDYNDVEAQLWRIEDKLDRARRWQVAQFVGRLVLLALASYGAWKMFG